MEKNPAEYVFGDKELINKTAENQSFRLATLNGQQELLCFGLTTHCTCTNLVPPLLPPSNLELKPLLCKPCVTQLLATHAVVPRLNFVNFQHSNLSGLRSQRKDDLLNAK